MANKKPIHKMSAGELYELARQREQEEAEAEREARRSQINELRAKRRDLVAEHNKALAEIEKEIRALGGRTRRVNGARGRKPSGLSEQVISILEKNGGEVSTKDIRDQLERSGMSTDNLAQTMAYLKRTGRIDSPRRAVYTLAG